MDTPSSASPPDASTVLEADGSGYTIENRLGGTAAPRYRKWQIDLVSPHLGRSTMEIGAGMGHFSAELAKVSSLDRLVLADNEQYTLDRLQARYANRPDIEVTELNLPGAVSVGEPLDSIVAMNVIEHIDDDVGAMRDLSAALNPGGRLIIWVPGYPQLYGDFDRKVGHVTRYTPKTLQATVTGAGLDIDVLKPINFLGGIAWWVAVRRGGAGYPDPKLVKIYDRTVVPTTRFIEKLIRPPFGQTVFCVARVPESPTDPATDNPA
jgi:SAM-dependent methyltransferase